MSAGAIAMMIIGCGLLWGTFIFSVQNYFRAEKREKEKQQSN